MEGVPRVKIKRLGNDRKAQPADFAAEAKWLYSKKSKYLSESKLVTTNCAEISWNERVGGFVLGQR
jgi:hypothetical protein